MQIKKGNQQGQSGLLRFLFSFLPDKQQEDFVYWSFHVKPSFFLSNWLRAQTHDKAGIDQQVLERKEK